MVEAVFAGGALILDDEEWSREVVDGAVVDDVWSRDVEEGAVVDRGADCVVFDPAKLLVLVDDRLPCTSRSALQAYANKVVRSVYSL